MSQRLVEMEVQFDERGHATLDLPEAGAGVRRVYVEVDAGRRETEADATAAAEPAGEPPLEIIWTGEHFRWPTWEWTGFPADHIFTREDFYDEDE